MSTIRDSFKGRRPLLHQRSTTRRSFTFSFPEKAKKHKDEKTSNKTESKTDKSITSNQTNNKSSPTSKNSNSLSTHTPFGIKKRPNQRRLLDRFSSPSLQIDSQIEASLPSASTSENKNVLPSGVKRTLQRGKSFNQKSKIPKFDFKVVSHSFTPPSSKKTKDNDVEVPKVPSTLKSNDLGKSRTIEVPQVVDLDENSIALSTTSHNSSLRRSIRNLGVHVISPFTRASSESNTDVNLERPNKPQKPLLEKNIPVDSRESSIVSFEGQIKANETSRKGQKLSLIQEQPMAMKDAASALSEADLLQELRKIIKENPFSIPLELVEARNAVVVPRMEVEVLSSSSVKAIKWSAQRARKTKLAEAPNHDSLDVLEEVLLFKPNSPHRTVANVNELEVGLTAILNVFAGIRKSTNDRTILHALNKYESSIVKGVTNLVSKIIHLQHKGKKIKELETEIARNSQEIGLLMDAKLQRRSH